jgi:hypothetical protein
MVTPSVGTLEQSEDGRDEDREVAVDDTLSSRRT